MRRWSRSKLSEPRSSIRAISCGWWIAAVAMPVAGEAPQRRKVAPIFSALSGRIGSTMPAPCSTFSSKAESAAEARSFDALSLRFPMRREDYSLCTEATAMQAMPSPRPIQPMPSLVVALTLTRAEVASARVRSISAR